MEITFPGLATINNAVSLAYNTQFFTAETRCDPFVYDASSTGDAEVYPRLDLIGGLREWLGERAVERLSLTTFSIPNKTYEKTIGVKRENLEDDKYGFLSPAAQQLGQNAKHFRDIQIAKLLASGNTTANGYDGVPFFSTAHPTYTSAGSATGPNTTVANYQSGAGPSWYLLATKQVIKPLIWQTRRPFQLIPLFSMTDPIVFSFNEFQWGIDGRCNAGYGLWHFIYRSDAAMTIANVIAGLTAMASIRRPDGAPMGIVPDILMTGVALHSDARAYAENEFVPIDAVTGAATLAPNILRGQFSALKNEWIP